MSRQPAVRLLAVIAGFVVVLGCAIATGELLGLAERPDGSTSVDSSITSWLVGHRSHGLTTLARLFSTLGSQAVLAPLTAIATLALAMRRRFDRAVALAAAWGGAICLYSLTKAVVDRMRPPAAIWLTDVGRTTSFPSGHATQSLATFTVLALVCTVGPSQSRRGLAMALALALAIGVGWSRAYLGVHWASDVAAGWLIAGAWISIVWWLTHAARSGAAKARTEERVV